MRQIPLLLAALCALSAVAAGPDLKSVPPETFLSVIREPLRDNAWGEFTGSIASKSNSAKRKGILRVRVTFTPDAMMSQIVLNDRNVYTLEQSHRKGAAVTTKLERPDKEEAPGLFDFGVQPSDLTFSFIYWEFERELPSEKGISGVCRVMRLREPGTQRFAHVWFNLKYGFPEKVVWFTEGSSAPLRTLEMKGARRHENGLWFVREMKLSGDGWKSLVTFDHVEFNEVGAP